MVFSQEFGGPANDPSIQKHLEWGMPEHSYSRNMPYPYVCVLLYSILLWLWLTPHACLNDETCLTSSTRFPATMSREELLDDGQPVEAADALELEHELAKAKVGSVGLLYVALIIG